MTMRALTDRDYNVRIAAKAREVQAIAERARARGRGPNRELGHTQRAVLAALGKSNDLCPSELGQRLGLKTHLLVYSMAALQVRGEIEKTDTGKWRRVKRGKQGRAAA